MDFMRDFFMFCPICKERVKPEESKVLKDLIREKAKNFAQSYNLKDLIAEKNFNILDIFTKFKKLEDNCKFCPNCQWSPFNTLVADGIFKKFKIEFSSEIKKAGKPYLLDYLFPNEGKTL